MTSSTCAPQPLQVTRLHWRHKAGLHMCCSSPENREATIPHGVSRTEPTVAAGLDIEALWAHVFAASPLQIDDFARRAGTGISHHGSSIGQVLPHPSHFGVRGFPAPAYGSWVTPAYAHVVRACRVMERAGGPVDVTELAHQVPCSVRQLQRDFREVIGATPRAYGQAVRTGIAKQALRGQPSVGDAIFAAGYGSVRAFYDETAKRLGMEPREYANGGGAQVLLWAATPTAIGQVAVVASMNGLCSLVIGNDQRRLVEQVLAEFPNATVKHDEVAMRDVLRALRAIALGDVAPDLPTDVAATAFQARVWSALRHIPKGQTRSYSEVAESINHPTAVRAVARACAMNPVALVVPCHRVIRNTGELSGYAWGIEIKQALLDIESADPALHQ